ncbi:MAG: (5-formylfuran-3-yl)methyl phosphate synthase, partial [Thermoproteota archaeon]
MKLLISVVSPWEALEASAGGADIIDVKEPSRGSIGAPETSTIKAIKSILPP